MEDVECWISATPIECLSDPDIECDRGGKEALLYRQWLGLNVFFLGFCVIFISRMVIVHFVLVQKHKSDRYSLRSGNEVTACGSRMSGCFVCVKSCLDKVFTTVKEHTWCGNRTNKDARANKHGQVMDGNDNSPSSFDPTTTMLLSRSSDPLPTLQACLAPVKIMANPTFQDTTAKQDAGKNVCCGEENGQSQNGSKPRAPRSRSGTGTDPYKFNTAKVRAAIKRESLIAVKPPPLASVQATSPLAVKVEDGNEDGDNSNSPNNSVEREVIVQALLCTGCFFLTYIFSVTARMIQMQGKEVSFAVLFLARFFQLLQGFFNIMVYMRPHIVSLRRNNPAYSWFKSVTIVFKAGGDNDSVGQVQRSSQQPASDADVRRRQKLIERDHNRRMEKIKRKSMVSENFIAAARQAQEADEESGGKDGNSTHTIDEKAFARRSSATYDTCLIEHPLDIQSASVV